MKRTSVLLPIILLAATVLGGCGFMRDHFGRKEPPYQGAPQNRPLEVPPGLDAPSSSSALTIPAAAGPSAATAASAAPPVSAAPPAAAPAATTPAASQTAPSAEIAARPVISGGDLHVADTVESTWHRVGLALERSGAGTITARDEAGHAYAITTTGKVGNEPGWFKRMATFGQARASSTPGVPLTVRVSADGSGSKVSIEGATDKDSREAAAAVLAALRKRLS